MRIGSLFSGAALSEEAASTESHRWGIRGGMLPEERAALAGGADRRDGRRQAAAQIGRRGAA